MRVPSALKITAPKLQGFTTAFIDSGMFKTKGHIPLAVGPLTRLSPSMKN